VDITKLPAFGVPRVGADPPPGVRRASEGVWKLSARKVFDTVEAGGSIDEIDHFLKSRTTAELPATAVRFRADLRTKAARVGDAGPARVIAGADEHAAAERAADRQLKRKCFRAGDRFVVVRESASRRSERRFANSGRWGRYRGIQSVAAPPRLPASK